MYTIIRYINDIGRLIALVSFVLATTLFLMLWIDGNAFPAMVGFYITIATVLINALIGAVAIFCLVFFPFNRASILKTAGIMLLNIPVVGFYFYLMAMPV